MNTQRTNPSDAEPLAVPTLVGDQVTAYAAAVRADAFTDVAAMLTAERLPVSAELVEAQRALEELEGAPAGGSYRAALLGVVEKELRAAADEADRRAGSPGAADMVRLSADMVRDLFDPAAAAELPAAAEGAEPPAKVFTVLGYRYDFTQDLVVTAVLRGGHSRAVLELSSGAAGAGADEVSPYALDVVAQTAEHAKRIAGAVCPTCGVADWERHPRRPLMWCSNCKEHAEPAV
ncbi:hypothetical protein AB0O57_29035 [Streptomyces sp. NPDC091201]|uniref:hypothetical protein n=1 Tax=Streptomyces sp. NPDC091201 TaxID=3155190 RepID=UPI00341F9B01